MQSFVNGDTLGFEGERSRGIPGHCLDRSRHVETGERENWRLDPPMDLQLDLITTRAGFDALESEWNALFERAGRGPQIFQSFDWLWHWANHYLGRGASLCIVTGRLQGRLVMVWPLVLKRVMGFKQLSWMGEPTIEYGDLLVDQELEAQHLIRHTWTRLRSLQVDLMYLRKIRSDAMILPFLTEIAASPSNTSSAPFLDLASTPTFEAYQLRYTPKTRGNYRRHLRRLSETGRITFIQYAQGSGARELAKRALAMKRAWLLEEGRFSRVLQDARFARFLSAIADGSIRPVGARLSAICCDRKAIAVEISIASRTRIFGHLIAHDPGYRKQGPGRVLAQYSIAAAHRDGFAIYDLLAPDDGYKMDWADGSVGLRDYVIPLSRFGSIHGLIWIRYVRRWAKLLINAAPTRCLMTRFAFIRRSLALRGQPGESDSSVQEVP